VFGLQVPFQSASWAVLREFSSICAIGAAALAQISAAFDRLGRRSQCVLATTELAIHRQRWNQSKRAIAVSNERSPP